ncbi:MAG: hypothetical protein ACI89D_000681 [Bermanella sp.]|jgi:hypothetical protein
MNPTSLTAGCRCSVAIRGYALLLAALLCSSFLQASCDFDDFPIPAGIEPQWFMQGIVYNGVTLNVKTFNDEGRQSSVQNFYRKRWDKEYGESEIDEWHQFIHLEDGCLYQVQSAQAGDRVYGRLTLTPLDGDEDKPVLGAGIDMPVDTMTVMDMRSDDDYKKGRSVVMANSRSAHENMAFFRSSMLRQGWHIEMEQRLAEGMALVVKKRGDRVSVVISESENQTQIFYNAETID